MLKGDEKETDTTLKGSTGRFETTYNIAGQNEKFLKLLEGYNYVD